VTIYLVRHARAGERSAWDGEDWLRPLSGRGHAQARALIDVLEKATFEHVLSSPYVRCIETVVPIATVRGFAVEPDDALEEGAAVRGAVALVQKHLDHGAVLCTHGDVMPALLEYYAKRGVDIGPAPQWPKGCTWVLKGEHGEVRSAKFIPAPD
jgi:8-oxo-dGTP diphosphatase